MSILVGTQEGTCFAFKIIAERRIAFVQRILKFLQQLLLFFAELHRRFHHKADVQISPGTPSE